MMRVQRLLIPVVVCFMLGYATNAVIIRSLIRKHSDFVSDAQVTGDWSDVKTSSIPWTEAHASLRVLDDWGSFPSPFAGRFRTPYSRGESIIVSEPGLVSQYGERREIGRPFYSVSDVSFRRDYIGKGPQSAWDSGWIPAPAAVMRISSTKRYFTQWIWQGTLLNSLVFGSAWLGIWVLLSHNARSVVRIWRRRTGRCTGCGYDLAGLSSCPECNTPAEKAAGASV